MAGSAWSGSSPAVCESAIHGRIGTGGKATTGTGRQAWEATTVKGWPGSAAHGRHGAHGPTASGLAGMACSVLIGHGFSRQTWHGLPSIVPDWQNGHGRSRKVWLFFQWKARQDWSGEDGLSGLAPAGIARWARITRFPMARQERKREATRGFFWLGRQCKGCMVGPTRQEWHSTAGPVIAGNATQCIAGPLVARQAVQRSERQPTARQAPHDTERSARASRQARSGLYWKASNGRSGMIRQRLLRADGKERQARCGRSGRARRATHGRRCNCQTAA